MMDSFHKIDFRGLVGVRSLSAEVYLHPLARGSRLSILVLALQVVFASGAWAQLTPSAQASHGSGPVIQSTRGGADVVHIAAPSAAGVSHNKYQHFNVNPAGLILNNSAHATDTALGGRVQANPHLNQAARVILNEVTSASQSSLRGVIEVAGRRADVIVANPNGIQCDGCGFLNVGRATLTTGVPRIGADGNVSSFDIDRGGLTVGRGGLDARNLQQLDLLARGIEIQGDVLAERIHAIAGANQVSYDDIPATKGEVKAAGASPKFAIDISELGGMHARQIYLLATEHGLGVNSQGRLQARSGAMQLSATGDLRIENAYGEHGVTLRSTRGHIEVSGSVVSPLEVDVLANKQFRNEGSVAAGRRLKVHAHEIHNGGSLASGSHPRQVKFGPHYAADATGADEGEIELRARVRNDASGAVFSSGKLLVDGELHNHGGRIHALADITVTGKVFNENAGLRMQSETLLTPVRETSYSRESEPDIQFSEEAVRIDGRKNLILPSKNFAFDRFGHEPYDIEELLSPQPVAGAKRNSSGTTIEKVWELFGLSRDELAGAVTVEARRSLAREKLKPKLDDFNSDLAARRIDRYFVRTTRQHEIRQDRVVGSQPGQIIAGGGISLAGGLNEDSLIEAKGSFLSSGGFENRSNISERTVIAHGDVRHVTAAGAEESGKVARQSKAQPVISVVSGERITTDVVTTADMPLAAQSVRQPSVSTVTASAVQVSAPAEPFINSGSILARKTGQSVESHSAGDIRIDAERIIHAGEMVSHHTTLSAEKELILTGGKIGGFGSSDGADSSISLSAGRNVELLPVMSNFAYHQGDAVGKATLASEQSVVAAGKVDIRAGQDFIGEGSIVQASQTVAVRAARHLQVSPAMEHRSTGHNGNDSSSPEMHSHWRESHTAAKVSKFESGGSVNLHAEQELGFSGSQASGDALELKGMNVRLTDARLPQGVEGQSVGDSEVHRIDVLRDDSVASILEARTNARLNAEADLDVIGSEVQVRGGPGEFRANGDVRISGAVTERRAASNTRSRQAFWFSRAETEVGKTLVESALHASRLEGRGLLIASQRDVNLSASTVTSEKSIDIQAGRHIALGGGQHTTVVTQGSQTNRQTGLDRHSGVSVMLGRKTSERSTESISRLVAPTSVIAKEGDVNVSAEGLYKQAGGDISAGKNVNVHAGVIEVLSESGHEHMVDRTEFNTMGLTAGPGAGGATGSLAAAGNNYWFGSRTASTQAQVLRAASGVRSAYSAYTQLPAAWTNARTVVAQLPGLARGEIAPLLRSLRATFGVAWDRSNELSKDEVSSPLHASKIHAGERVSLQTHGQGGSISIQGASIAGGHVELSAENVTLGAALSRSSLKKNSDNVGIGAAHEVGGRSLLTGYAYYGYGGSEAQEQRYLPTKVRANSVAEISSASSISLRGGSVEGDSVRLQAGGNIAIETLQVSSDSSAMRYDLDGSAGVGGAYSAGGSGAGGRASAHYAMTTEKSGVFAGDGGFNIEASGVVSLAGGSLGSSASKDKNRIIADHLQSRGVSNVSEYYSALIGRGVGYDGSSAPSVTERPVIPRLNGDAATQVTRSAIAPGVFSFTNGHASMLEQPSQQEASLSEAVPPRTLARPPAIGSVLLQQQQVASAVTAFDPDSMVSGLDDYVNTRETDDPTWRYGDWLRRAGRDVVDALVGPW